MSETRPCKEFVQPPKGTFYAAYCERCHFSKTAHDEWDEWDRAARLSAQSFAESRHEVWEHLVADETDDDDDDCTYDEPRLDDRVGSRTARGPGTHEGDRRASRTGDG